MAQYNGKILIVDDNKDLLNALKLILTPYFSVIDTIRNPNQIQQMMEKKQYDLVLLDMNFSAGIATGNEGIFWFGRIREIDPKISVVFITAFGDVELAVRSLKEGATDFIMKSWDEQKILSTILAAYRLQMTRQELSLLKKKHKHLSGEIRNEFAGNSVEVSLTGQEKRQSPVRSTRGRSANGKYSLRSILEHCRNRCSRANYSVTQQGHLPGRKKPGTGAFQLPPEVPFFWMKSETCLCRFSLKFFQLFRTKKYIHLVPPFLKRQIHELSLPRICLWKK